MPKLTPRQTRFVAEYIKDLNGTQAAIRAGYAAKHASAQSYQLLQKTTVQTAIAVAARTHMLRAGITARDVIEGLHNEATDRSDRSSHSARVAAWVALGRYHGLFDNRVERSVTHKLSDLSDEELVEWTERCCGARSRRNSCGRLACSAFTGRHKEPASTRREALADIRGGDRAIYAGATRVVTITGDLTLTELAHSDKVLLLGEVGGNAARAVALPAATGSVPASSSSCASSHLWIRVADATDMMDGHIFSLHGMGVGLLSTRAFRSPASRPWGS
jgi:hypothetical protein